MQSGTVELCKNANALNLNLNLNLNLFFSNAPHTSHLTLTLTSHIFLEADHLIDELIYFTT